MQHFRMLTIGYELPVFRSRALGANRKLDSNWTQVPFIGSGIVYPAFDLITDNIVNGSLAS